MVLQPYSKQSNQNLSSGSNIRSIGFLEKGMYQYESGAQNPWGTISLMWNSKIDFGEAKKNEREFEKTRLKKEQQ